MKNSEWIANAIDYFDGGKHWMKGRLWSYADKAGQADHACLVGALILTNYDLKTLADYEHDAALPCTSSIRDAIEQLFGDRIKSRLPRSNVSVVERFNDHDETTYEDIQLVLKTAFVMEEEKETA